MTVLENGTGLLDALNKRQAIQFYFSRAAMPLRRMPPAVVADKGAQFSTVKADYDNRRIPLVALANGALQFTWADTPRPADFVAAGVGDRLTGHVSSVDAKGTLQDDPGAALAVTECSPPQDLCTRVDRAKLEKGKTYVIERDRDAVISHDLDRESPAMDAWNIEQPDAERIVRTSKVFPDKPHVGPRAGLTPDLSKFLTALQGRMFSAPVRLSTYYLYVQAN